MTEYKQINGYDGYFINKQGQVLSTKRVHPKIMKTHIKGNGYIEVTLSPSKGVYKQLGLHRLLAETFIEKPHNAEVVNHKDGNTQNNNLDNLEWVTQSENTLHAIYTLKKKTHTQKTMIVDGVKFESIAECAKHFGVNKCNISSQFSKGIIPRVFRGKTVIFE